MYRMLSAVLVALTLGIHPLHADDATNAASNRIFGMVMTYDLPFGTTEMGQKISLLQFGNSSMLTIAHPEKGSQKKKLVFTFTAFREKPIISHIEDLGPVGLATNVKIDDAIKVDAAEVVRRYGEILACVEEIANSERMCSNGTLIFDLLGLPSKNAK